MFFSRRGRLALIFGLVAQLSVGAVWAQDKAAGKKADSPEKALATMTKTLDELLGKVQSRTFFTAKDAQNLVQLKYQLLDLMATSPSNPALARPLYQAGKLFAERDMPPEAIDLLTYVSTQFPNSPYGLRARGDLAQIRRVLGPEYFQALEEGTKPKG